MRIHLSLRLGLPLALFLLAGLVGPAGGQAGSVIKLYHKSFKQLSADDLARMSARYELLFAVESDQVATIRSRNQKVLVILYELPGGRWKGEDDYDVVNAKESWFVHDLRGNRVQNNNRLWLLDIGNPEYRAYEVDVLMKKMAASGYDGLYFDVVHAYWVERRGWNDPAGNPTTLPAAVMRDWPTNMLSFIETVRARLDPQKKLLWNTLALTVNRAREWAAWEQRALTVANGAQLDGFCFNRDRAYAAEDWRHQVNRIVEVAAMGKLVLAKGTVDRDVGPALDRLKLFCFASYLLAADGKFAYYWPSLALGEPNFDPRLYGVTLGVPAGPYRQVQGVFQRDFAAGRVLVNPGPVPVTVRLEGAFRTHAGAALGSTLTLEPLSALVLVKS